MRAYLEIAVKSFQETISSRAEALIRVIAMLLALSLLNAFWKALYGASAEVQGISFRGMLTYAMLSALTGGVLNIFGLLQVYVASHVSWKVRTGAIVTDLLRPVDFQLSLFFHSLGRLGFNVLLTIPLAAAAWAVFRLEPPAGASAALLAAASLAISSLLVFLLDFLVALVAFWTTQIRSINGFLRLVITLLSGSFIPLWFFPPRARDALALLPFASIYHAPLSLYIGRLRGTEALRTILVQLAWVLVLLAGGRLLWAKARRLRMTNGG